MVLACAVLLLIHAVWNLLVWPPILIRRMLKDPRSRTQAGEATRFQRTQLGLLGTAAVLGLLSLVFGLLVVLSPSLVAAG